MNSYQEEETMKKCRQCGAEMNDNVLFCTKCGTKMEAQKEPEVQQNTQQNVNMNTFNYGQQNAGYAFACRNSECGQSS